ncbi:hypothetical protein [Alishewanella longhuensis]
MNKNKFLLLFILCCVLPLLAAKLVLELGWFNPGSSSRGQWLQQEIYLLDDAQQAAKPLAYSGSRARVPATTLQASFTYGTAALFRAGS